MFFKRRQKKTVPCAPDQAVRIVTSSFADTSGGRLTALFAEAEKMSGTSYLIYSAKRDAKRGRGTHMRELIAQPDTLREALEVLDEWERNKSALYPVSEQGTDPTAPHYTEIAKQLGSAVGPNMASALHSDRIKRVVAARRRAGPR